MTETIGLIVAISMLISGLIITFIGFEFIKRKTKKPEDEERMIVWRKKFGKFFKIGGIVILILSGFLLIAPNSDNESSNWTQSQKEQMKQQVIKSSNFLQSMNPDTADLVATCFIDKYTKALTRQQALELDKMTQEKILELTMPIMKDCFEIYGIQIDK